MPRPKRDYAAAIKDDIAKLDERIRALVVQRSRLAELLKSYQTIDASTVNTSEVLRSILNAKPVPKKKGR